MKNWHLIVGFILIAVLAIAIPLVGMIGNREQAEDAARNFAASLYPGTSPVRAVCQNSDTDNNGYVSCTLVVGDRPPQALECASRLNMRFVSGCRIARAVLSNP